MSIITRITPEGQITIPRKIRDKLGLTTGTEVEFVTVGRGVLLLKANGKTQKATRGEAAIAALWGTADMGMTTDEVMMLTRGRRMPGKKKAK